MQTDNVREDQLTNTRIDNSDHVNKILAKATAKASTIAALPVPIVDIAGVTYIHYNLLNDLSNFYNRPVENKTALLMAAAIGGLTTKLVSEIVEIVSYEIGLEDLLSDSLIKATFAGIITTVIGEVFNGHLQTGGTVDSLSFDSLKNYVADQLGSNRFSVDELAPKLIESITNKFNIDMP